MVIGIMITLICVFAFLLAICLGAIFGQQPYSYTFEEKTVRASYLEEARRKLVDMRSPLIKTDDPTVI